MAAGNRNYFIQMFFTRRGYFLNLIIAVLLYFYPAFAGNSSRSFSNKMNIGDVTKIALKNNLDIKIAKMGAYIQRNNLGEAESIFDTFINAGLSYDKNKQDTASALTGTSRTVNNYSVGISKKIPSGTTLSADIYDRRLWSNSPFYTVNPDTEANAEVSLIQPLAKDFFGIIERGSIKITRLGINSFDLVSLDKIEESLSHVQKAYWKLVLRNEELRIKKDILCEAEKLYSIYQREIKTGLVEEPDLLAAKANVALHKNDILKTKMELKEAENNLLYLLNLDSVRNIIPDDRLNTKVKKLNFYNELKKAVKSRRDYKIAKNKLSSENINLVMKKNSLWPQINLSASFTKNGIDSGYKRAWSEINNKNYSHWYVGINIKFPLEMRKEKAQYSKAKLSRARAIIAIKRVERMIFRNINNTVTELNTISTRVETNRKIVRLEEEKLKAEEERLKYGRSSSDIIIRFQNDLLNARLNLARSFFSYHISLINVGRSENILLSKYWKGTI